MRSTMSGPAAREHRASVEQIGTVAWRTWAPLVLSRTRAQDLPRKGLGALAVP
jgi:hypothetical protein